MKKIGCLISLLLMAFLVGCQPQQKVITPTITDIRLSASSGFADEGEDFKIYFTIENPYPTEFPSYIKVNYDNDLFRLYDTQYSSLSSLQVIPPNSQKNFDLRFQARDLQPTATKTTGLITILLAGSSTATYSLDSKTLTVKVSESVR